MKIASWARSPLERLGAVAWGSFWSLPLAMLGTTIVIVAALLVADASGASATLAGAPWPLSLPAKTAQEVASSLVTTYAALVSLYFSISLLVLTLAGGTLGIRLIDIWIARRVTRATLGLLLSMLAASVLVLTAIDSDANGAHAARLTLLVTVAATIGVIGWLAFALHDLARTIHIDTSIADLRERLNEEAGLFPQQVAAPDGIDWQGATIIAAPHAGFVESIDFDDLAAKARQHDLRIEVSALPGDYRLAGEALGRFTGGGCAAASLAERFSLADCRSASEGATFRIRLLVEIAARALSPAINDFYTALACVDALGSAMAVQGQRDQAMPWLGDEDGVARVQLVTSPFADLFDAPLNSLRQAASAYPAVAIHHVMMLRRAAQLSPDPGVSELLVAHAQKMRDAAIRQTDFAPDVQAIERAMSDTLPATA